MLVSRHRTLFLASGFEKLCPLFGRSINLLLLVVQFNFIAWWFCFVTGISDFSFFFKTLFRINMNYFIFYLNSRYVIDFKEQYYSRF